MRYGSFSVETSYQPSGPPFSAAMRPASVMRPSTSVTFAPYSRHSSTNGCFASFGMNTSQARPAAARVRGGRVAGIARRRQRDRARAEVLGACDRRRLAARLERVRRVERFVLDVEAIEAERRAERLRVEERREPFAERHRRFAVEQRQHLAISPHVRLAGPSATRATTRAPCRDRSGRGAARRTSTEMVPLTRIARRRAARHGTFEMGEEVDNRHMTKQTIQDQIGDARRLCFCLESFVRLLFAEQLAVLLLLEVVDVLDVAVGELLDFVEPLLLVVFGDLVILQQLLQPIVRVAADLADACCGLLRSACARASTAPCGALR